jgi:hypothetical protein
MSGNYPKFRNDRGVPEIRIGVRECAFVIFGRRYTLRILSLQKLNCSFIVCANNTTFGQRHQRNNMLVVKFFLRNRLLQLCG